MGYSNFWVTVTRVSAGSFLGVDEEATLLLHVQCACQHPVSHHWCHGMRDLLQSNRRCYREQRQMLMCASQLGWWTCAVCTVWVCTLSPLFGLPSQYRLAMSHDMVLPAWLWVMGQAGVVSLVQGW
jgi:hypothetical protein